MTSLEFPRVRPVVLCIDDDPGIAAILSKRLEEFNVDVATAYFGTEGVSRALTQHPDVILTDMSMPQGCGNYVMECLKGSAETRDIPAIVLTGSKDRESGRRMLALGVNHYLHKPLPFDALLRLLARYIPLRYHQIHSASCVGGPKKSESP